MTAGREAEESNAIGVDVVRRGVGAEQLEGALSVPHGHGIAICAVLLDKPVPQNERRDVQGVREVLSDGRLLFRIGEPIVAAARDDEQCRRVGGDGTLWGEGGQKGDVAAEVVALRPRSARGPEANLLRVGGDVAGFAATVRSGTVFVGVLSG